MKNSTSEHEKPASELIDERIRELGDWRGKTFAKVRQIIKEADPEIVEETEVEKANKPCRSARLVPQWRHLYWRDLQGSLKVHLLQGCFTR